MTRFLLVWTLIFLGCCAIQMSYGREKPRKCTITRSYKMLSADCNALDLTAIPSDIQTDIEVMDASFNRIRELPCGAFDKYSGLKLLYLGDNLITTIEDGTFMNLVDLEVLDLSLNALKTIPLELMNMKNLRKLYMDKNLIGASSLEQLSKEPGEFALKSLSLASCGLEKLPPLNKFPGLVSLNLSGNSLKMLYPKDLAPACDLKEIDLNDSKGFSDADCECQILKKYLNEKSIRLVPPFKLNCSFHTIEDESCSNTTSEHNRESQEIFSSCINHKLLLKEAAAMKTLWWTIGGVVLGSILLLLFGVLCYKRRMKKRNAKKEYSRNNNLNHPPGLMQGGTTNLLEDRPLQDRGFNLSSFS